MVLINRKMKQQIYIAFNLIVIYIHRKGFGIYYLPKDQLIGFKAPFLTNTWGQDDRIDKTFS